MAGVGAAAAVAPDPMTDVYGFPLDLSAQQYAEREKCIAKGRQREARYWDGVTEASGLPSNATLLKKMCRKGIPPHIRPWAWLLLSGGAQRRAAFPATYFQEKAAELENAPADASVRQIDLDLGRTFPSHQLIRSPEGQAQLRRVLVAYAAHNPAVGYCQSMNYVAAVILLVVRDVESAFWVLVALIEDRLLQHTYDSAISGCVVEVHTLEQLVRSKLPRLRAHLQRTNTNLIATVPQWYLSLYFQDLPIETAVRVFDALLFEGSKILHRVALALLKTHERALLKERDVVDIATTLRRATQQMYDQDTLMKVACKRIGSLARKKLDALRAEQQPDRSGPALQKRK